MLKYIGESKMTCLICEKCGGQEFEQQQAYYNKGVLTQVFKCKKCGTQKHIPAMASAIIIPGECLPKMFPASSGDARVIVVGKHNSPEKPCQFCGSTTTCDCPLDIIQPTFATLKYVCVVCGKTYVTFYGHEFTCSEKCHKELCEKLVAMFGGFKKVVDAETGIAYKIPTRDILEKGLRHEDLVKYPEWR